MDKFTKLSGVAAPLPRVNVDTDAIIPKQYLKTIKRTGLKAGLFYEWRTNQDGSEKPDFVLNKPAYRNAQVLIAGANFGCGSSREHAPWALLDFGIRCVIAPSFADIFFSNCFKNGMLPVRLAPADAAEIRRALKERPGAEMTVDLETQTVVGPGNRSFAFDVDPFAKECLLQGLDDVAFTLRHEDAIAAYEARQAGRLSRL
jgi:3-isopropylmalate/(R)-2-methylmalate dehydratase small subunit